MHAILVRRHGGPEVLEPAEVPDPRPQPAEVLVAVEASGVNFIDVYHRSGAYSRSLPFVPGVEAAGTVVEVGAAVTGVRPGDRVAWVNLPGGYAQRAAVPAARVVPVPDGISTQAAAAVLLQGMTAHYLTHDAGRVRPGDTVLVHAAAGGMGLLLTQFVRQAGGRVIGTVSTAEKERHARAAGADAVIRATTTDLAGEVRELTGGRGVAAVFDGVGAPTFDASLASLRPRGVLAVYGQAGGPVPPVDLQRLNAAGSVFVTRPNLDHYIADRQELTRRAREVFDAVATGRVRVHLGGHFPLAAAGAAHTELESRRSVGKLLLTTDARPARASRGEPPP